MFIWTTKIVTLSCKENEKMEKPIFEVSSKASNFPHFRSENAKSDGRYGFYEKKYLTIPYIVFASVSKKVVNKGHFGGLSSQL